mgnify:CR=1 FL=1
MRWLLLILLFLVAAVSFPPQWHPEPLRQSLARWFGAAAWQPAPDSKAPAATEPELACPPDPAGWREEQVIDRVFIRASDSCVADNPYAVAAFVRGTNEVSEATLLASGLTPDAVVKGADLDGDGDPDEIHIRLEVAELNGNSPDGAAPTARYAIAPGIQPGFWTFVPKHAGMATENFASPEARTLLRLPAPSIRVEQGDRLWITLENSHYMPHTLHLHGADHGFVDAGGEGNDGVPLTSEMPVMPGAARRYELTPRVAGTQFYHCHVQPHVHVMMGLQGLFVVEENRPYNWVQTFNVGAAQVRVPSAAVREDYAREYDLHYMDLDKELNDRIRTHQDARLITKSMHRDYDITEATRDYFLLNGRAFPYTMRESLVVLGEDETVKLRVVNGGGKGIALHTHGHKVTVTHRDGVPTAPEIRDVVWLATAQRLDLALSGRNDGRSSYGAGIWPFHDHGNSGVTNDGIGPGGNISAIVYPEYLRENGWPRLQGVSWDPYFTAAYYRRELPVWAHYAPTLFGEAESDARLTGRLVIFGLTLGALLVLAVPRRRA